MPRNGSGVYNAPANTKGVPNTTIESSRYNAFIDDLEAVLTGSVATDGQTPMTGALAMGGSKITGLAAATAAADAVTKQQLDDAVSAAQTALRAELNAPTGTRMLFPQAAAPTGWTLDAAQNDRVLRVSSSAGGGAGGSWTISGLTVQSHTLTQSQIPSHRHFTLASVAVNSGLPTSSTQVARRNSVLGGLSSGDYQLQNTATDASVGRSSAVGSSGAHAHSLSADGAWRPAYVDAIICTKD